MDKTLTSAIVIAVIALISFSVIAVAADRIIESNTRGTCRGAVTTETQFFERSARYGENIMSMENVGYSESLETQKGTTVIGRKFFVPAGGFLDVTTFTNYSAEKAPTTSFSSGLGMLRSEQAEIWRTVVSKTPVYGLRPLCPFYVEHPPTIFGEETARGYNEQNVKEILVTTRTIVDVSGMEILHGINATGRGSCSVGMSLNTQGEMGDRLNWNTETAMHGEFDFESVVFQKGSTTEDLYNLIGRGRP